MITAVIGSRGIHMRVDAFIPAETEEIITGGARGIDRDAERYAAERGLPCTVIYPDYRRFGRCAPLVRNEEIVRRADVVVAVWDGVSAGTRHSLQYARSLHKEVRVYIVPTE